MNKKDKIIDKNTCGRSGSKMGFTLLELILSMTILSMVALIIGSGFRLGLQAWEKGETEVRSSQRLRSLPGLISQDLKSAFPYKMEIEKKKIIVFEGGNNFVLLATTLSDPSEGGFRWVKYLYDSDTRSLIFNEGILPDKDFIEKTSEEGEIVDRDIGEISFEYFSLEEEEWTESWDFGEELPFAIKVNMEYYPSFLVTLPVILHKKKKDKDDVKGFL
jgi:general secretion pathway protein J